MKSGHAMRSKRGFGFLAFAAVALVAALMSGCGQPSPEEQIRADMKSQLDSIDVENEEFVEDIASSAGAEFDQLSLDPKEFAKAYLSGFGYQIGDVTMGDDGATATVSVEVSAKSGAAVLSDYQAGLAERMGAADASAIKSEQDFYAAAGEELLAAAREVEPELETHKIEYAEGADGAWQPTDAGAAEFEKIFA